MNTAKIIAVTQNEEIERLERMIVELKEALRPFANIAATTADIFPDHDIMVVRLGQCRDAYEVLWRIDNGIETETK